MSGNVVEAIPHSASGTNLSDSNIEAYDDEDPDGIYKDIEDICESLTKEVAAADSSKDTTKKSSILSFLKSVKNKGKKSKELPKAVSQSETPVDLEFHEEEENDTDVLSPPDDIPTSPSASESYDEMRPNSGYLSDNYEDVGFDAEANAEAPPIPPPMVLEEPSVPPTLERPKGMGKLLLRSVIGKKDLNPATVSAQPRSNISKTDDIAFTAQATEKRNKLKEQLNVKMYSTLPRKAKLAGIGVRPESPQKQPEASAAVAVDSASPNLIEQISALKKEVESVKTKLDSLSSAVEFLTAGQQRPSRQVGSMSHAENGTGQESEDLGSEMNSKLLTDLSVDQVLKLLDSMDIPQYKQKFFKEQITGLVLSMVDDEMLREDLGVASKLHRVRLLRVATGQVSVVSSGYPWKDSKYVKFTK